MPPITHPRSTAWLKSLPGDVNAVPPTLAGACRAALSRQLGCGFPFFSEEEGLPVDASMAVPAGREMGGWMAACCGCWSRHSLGKHWLGAKEQHCESCSPTTFLLQRALSDGAEIVQ